MPFEQGIVNSGLHHLAETIAIDNKQPENMDTGTPHWFASKEDMGNR